VSRTRKRTAEDAVKFVAGLCPEERQRFSQLWPTPEKSYAWLLDAWHAATRTLKDIACRWAEESDAKDRREKPELSAAFEIIATLRQAGRTWPEIEEHFRKTVNAGPDYAKTVWKRGRRLGWGLPD
jgi:hypothetical protein